MRALLLAVLISCATVTGASAQVVGRGERGSVSDQREAAPTPTVSYQNLCIITELIDPPGATGYLHAFYFRHTDGSAGQVDITAQGLRPHSATQVAPFPGSAAADTRFAGMIETLRGAAVARAPVSLGVVDGIVTRMTVYWIQSCS